MAMVLRNKLNENTILKVIRVMVLCAVFYGFGSTVAGLYQRYDARPVGATNTERGQPFVWPDVTVCSSVRYDKDRIDHLIVFPGVPAEDTREASKYRMRWQYYRALFLDHLDKNDTETISFVESLITTHINQEDDSFTKRPFEVIFDCAFKGGQCSYKNFTVSRHPYQPNCLTFVPNDRTPGEPGPGNGLKLILNNGIHNKVYNKDSSFDDDFRGFYVSVHAASTLPDLIDNVLQVSTGSNVDIKVTAKHHVSIDRPGHPCIQKRPSAVVGLANYVFSQLDCMEDHIQNHMIGECGCQHPEHYRISDPRNRSNVPTSCLQIATEVFHIASKVANVSEVYDHRTFTNLMKRREMKPLLLQFLCFYNVSYSVPPSTETMCPTYCNETQYSLSAGVQIAWPDGIDGRGLLEVTLREMLAMMGLDFRMSPASISNLLPYYFSQLSAMDDVMKSYALVNIYAADDLISSVAVKEIYGWLNLVSDVGGNMGLWMGASVLSFYQLIEWFLLAMEKCQQCRAKSMD